MKGIKRKVIFGEEKLCTRCESLLPFSHFNKSSIRKDGYQLWCISCSNKHTRNRYHNGDREKMKLATRKCQLKHQYGITIEEYEEMLQKQGGVCKICQRPETQQSNPKGKIDSLRVDHCHKTGKIRGLLCSKCNFGISQFGDDPSLLDRAISYLVYKL